MTLGTITYAKYIPKHQEAAWREVGWVVKDSLGPTHGHHSLLAVWDAQENPVFPKMEKGDD